MRSLFGNEPRAEEIINEVYRLVQEIRSSGDEASGIFLPISYIRRIRVYHRLLGVAGEKRAEYFGETSLFGVEIYVWGENSIKVEHRTQDAGNGS